MFDSEVPGVRAWDLGVRQQGLFTKEINMGNSMTDLMKFFSIPGKTCTPAEFKDFWASLTDADKAYYKTADLSA